jgi:hypothetical protein
MDLARVANQYRTISTGLHKADIANLQSLIDDAREQRRILVEDYSNIIAKLYNDIMYYRTPYRDLLIDAHHTTSSQLPSMIFSICPFLTRLLPTGLSVQSLG